MYLESHNLVQNIPHESTNGGPSTQRTILNVNSRSTEIPFPLFIYFDIFLCHRRTSKARGGGRGCERTNRTPPPPSLRACWRVIAFSIIIIKELKLFAYDYLQTVFSFNLLFTHLTKAILFILSLAGIKS